MADYGAACNRSGLMKRNAQSHVATRMTEKLNMDVIEGKKIFRLPNTYRDLMKKLYNIKSRKGEVLTTPEEIN